MRGAKTEQEDSFVFATDTTETPLSLPTTPWRLPDPIWGHLTALARASRWRPLGLALRRLTRAPDTPGAGGASRGRSLPDSSGETRKKGDSCVTWASGAVRGTKRS